MDETKSAFLSKINIAALAAGLVGVAAAVNLIPPELEEKVKEAALMLVGVLVPIFRIWFTSKKIG